MCGKLPKSSWKKGHAKFKGSHSFKKGKLIASKNPRWKGGRRTTNDGYILIYMPEHPFSSQKYILEHRYCAECYLGRFLEKNEVIHHIDTHPDNNLPENLYLFSSTSKHIKFHRKPYRLKSNLNI